MEADQTGGRLQAGVGRNEGQERVHLFRHTMATVMLEGGADVRYIIQAMLGHVSLATTPIYTHVTITKLREVHERTHPARLFRLAAPAPRHADSAAPPHCLANPDGGAETPSYGPADPLDVDHDATAGII